MNKSIEFSKYENETLYINIKINDNVFRNIDAKNPKINELRAILSSLNIKGISKSKKNFLLTIYNENFETLFDSIIKDKNLSFVNKNLKGSNCSIKGKEYEKCIYDIVSKCKLNNINFNTQKYEELGGCSYKNDIVCNSTEENNFGIEIKKAKAPDWVQCGLILNEENKWIINPKSHIPTECKIIFEKILFEKEITIFNGKIPPFLSRKISYSEWIKIKNDTKDFDDFYIDCPKDTISKLYEAKGCKYIQISDKGLYYLTEDICNFKVPKFECEQRIRIRIKVHSRGRTGEICNLSITAACQPKNFKEIVNSDFSLDSFEKLPKNLKYE